MSDTWTIPDRATEEERIECKVLANGRVAALRAYQDAPSESTLRNMRAAKEALAEYRAELDRRYRQPEPAPARPRLRDLQPTGSVMAVLRHLQAVGYRVKKSTLYNHAGQGLLRKNGDGLYTPALVRKYVRQAGLPRLDGTASDLPDQPAGSLPDIQDHPAALAPDQLPEEKLRQEVLKLRAQARREQLKADREAGRLIDREDLYLELAARAVVLNTGYRQLVAMEAPAWIAAAHGDPALLPEVESMMLHAWDNLIGQYATRDRFEVLFDKEEA